METKAEAWRAWGRRRPRTARLIAALLVYALAVGGSLLFRLARHDWTWHDDLLVSSLIVSLAAPAIALVSGWMTRWARDDEHTNGPAAGA